MTIEDKFEGLSLRKLMDLEKQGWKVNGVHIQREQEDGTVKHGAVTTGGMVLWWQPEQERVIAPSVRSVMQKALDALEAETNPAWECNSYHPKIHTAIDALREALATPQPAPQEPVATVIKTGSKRDWMSERLGRLPDGIYSLYTAPQAQPAQQEPDRLHLAAMNLARMQQDRIVELEQQLAAREPLSKAKVDNFKHWLNARRMLSVSEAFHEIVECYEAAAHGITKDPA